MKKVSLIILITIIFVLGFYYLNSSQKNSTQSENSRDINSNQTTSTIDTTENPATTMSKHDDTKLGVSIEYPSEWELVTEGDYAFKIHRKLKKPAASESNYILVQVIPTKINISDSAIYDFNRDLLNKLTDARTQKVNVSDNSAMSEYFNYEQKQGMAIGGKTSKMFVNTKPWEKPEGTTEYKHIISLDNKIIVITASLGKDTSDPFYISEENYLRIINTLKFTEKDNLSVAGKISGKLCYPSESLPEGVIEAKEINNNKTFEVNYAGSSKGGKNNYEINVEPGEYILRYKTANMEGYHTDVCPTGLETTCKADNPRQHIAAKIVGSETIPNIDLCDFYYGENTKPKF